MVIECEVSSLSQLLRVMLGPVGHQCYKSARTDVNHCELMLGVLSVGVICFLMTIHFFKIMSLIQACAASQACSCLSAHACAHASVDPSRVNFAAGVIGWKGLSP